LNGSKQKNYRDTALSKGKIKTSLSSQVIQPLYKTSVEKGRKYNKYFEDSQIYIDKWVSYFKYLVIQIISFFDLVNFENLFLHYFF
tara:strand:- start:96 stop:353 length:258 start_codon:yes stop_codon:yes gene_type:complete